MPASRSEMRTESFVGSMSIQSPAYRVILRSTAFFEMRVPSGRYRATHRPSFASVMSSVATTMRSPLPANPKSRYAAGTSSAGTTLRQRLEVADGAGLDAGAIVAGGATEAGASEPGNEVGARDGSRASEPVTPLDGFGELVVEPRLGSGAPVGVAGAVEPQAAIATAATMASADRAVERRGAIGG